MRFGLYAAVVMSLTLGACSTYVEEVASKNFMPVLPKNPQRSRQLTAQSTISSLKDYLQPSVRHPKLGILLRFHWMRALTPRSPNRRLLVRPTVMLSIYQMD